MREIEIIEGHDSGGCFWFRPVLVNDGDRILLDDDVVELEEEFSIEETDTDRFLAYYLFKYFDWDGDFNSRRCEPWDEPIRGFERNLTHNFYTYRAVEAMLQDISSLADALETDFDNPSLDLLKEYFAIHFFGRERSKMITEQEMRQVTTASADFYRRFVSRMTLMMKNNPDAFLISVMGP